MKNLQVKNIETAKTQNLHTLYPNKALMLVFYNNQCLGCTGRAIPLAYRIQQEFTQLQVLGVYVNFSQQAVTQSTIASIFTTNQIPFPIYLDSNATLYHHFKCSGTPHFILLNTAHQLVNSIFGSQTAAQNRLYYTLEEMFN